MELPCHPGSDSYLILIPKVNGDLDEGKLNQTIEKITPHSEKPFVFQIGIFIAASWYALG